MAVLYVTEFAQAGYAAGGGVIPVGSELHNASQTMAITGGSTTLTNSFRNNTNLIRVHTDVICSVEIGPTATVTASTTSRRMAANQTEYYTVPIGAAFNIAVISNT
jgi:hypothetical protein